MFENKNVGARENLRVQSSSNLGGSIFEYLDLDVYNRSAFLARHINNNYFTQVQSDTFLGRDS
jgi:hypothetical protein